MREPGFATCPNCLAVLGSVGCCTFKAGPVARLAQSLDNPALDAEMVAARADGSLVNAWKLSDGREVLATSGKIACAMQDGRIVRGDWPTGLPAKLAVVGILTEDPETLGGLL